MCVKCGYRRGKGLDVIVESSGGVGRQKEAQEGECLDLQVGIGSLVLLTILTNCFYNIMENNNKIPQERK